MDIQKHLKALSDDELIAATEQAHKDLKKAADEQPESEWHQACFAGLITYAGEVQRRGLAMQTLH